MPRRAKDAMYISSLSVPAPVRRAASRGTFARYSGFSPKMGRRLNFSTHLEFQHWLLLEGTPEVTHFCEYFPEVKLESWSFVFDMWVRFKDGREECREVVSDWHYSNLVDFTPRPGSWNYLSCWGREHGYACDLVTEQRMEPYLRRIQNWQRILPFVVHAMQNPDEDLEQFILLRLAASDLSLRELSRRRDPALSTHVTAVAAKLLHAGKITADLDRCHFGPDLLLKLPG